MKNLFKTVIVDDDPGCIRTLEHSLKTFQTLSLVGSAQNHRAARNLILETQPNLLFLDIEMPEITGLQFLQEIKSLISWPMEIVFYTVYDRYMLDAIRISAFDYLLKPYTNNELALIINRFLEASGTRKEPLCLSYPLYNISVPTQTFLIQTITGYQVFEAEKVVYFEYSKLKKRWLAYQEAHKSCYLKRGTTAEMILKYNPQYVQINQQQIINLSYLSKIDGSICFLIPPLDIQQDFIISRDFMKLLKTRLEMI
jgi:two-component system, LytTR family, response regulator